MSVSVCMATYNGEKYIEEQLVSILDQLTDHDEVIIVDDCSKDNTLSIVKDFHDPRVKIYINQVNLGHVSSFGRAISLAEKEIIVLADQDDIWTVGRIKLMKSTLIDADELLVSANSEYIDMYGKRIPDYVKGLDAADSKKYFKNIMQIFIGSADYFGCTMAFHKKLLKVIAPFPKHVESHDLWIALASNILRSNIHLSQNVLKRRVHGENASIISRNFKEKLWSRIIFIVSIITIFYRIIKNKDL